MARRNVKLRTRRLQPFRYQLHLLLRLRKPHPPTRLRITPLDGLIISMSQNHRSLTLRQKVVELEVSSLIQTLLPFPPFRPHWRPRAKTRCRLSRKLPTRNLFRLSKPSNRLIDHRRANRLFSSTQPPSLDQLYREGLSLLLLGVSALLQSLSIKKTKVLVHLRKA